MDQEQVVNARVFAGVACIHVGILRPRSGQVTARDLHGIQLNRICSLPADSIHSLLVRLQWQGSA